MLLVHKSTPKIMIYVRNILLHCATIIKVKINVIFYHAAILYKLLKMIQKSVKFLFCPIKVFIKLLILCSTLNIIATSNIYAENTLDTDKGADNTLETYKGEEGSTFNTIVDTITKLTCETQGLGQLLVRTEFAHTCIPAPVFTVAIANILSPILYIDTMTRLKINDPELFDSNNKHWKCKKDGPNGECINEFPGGQCARNNKIPYKPGEDPKLTFAVCNNAKLLVVNATAIGKTLVILAKAIFTNTEPWKEIAYIWRDSKLEYHDIYNIKDGQTVFIPDIPPVWVKGRQFKDTMCITVKGITWEDLPVGCKYISEPNPISIYQSFISPGGTTPDKKGAPADPMALVECGAASSTCYQRAYNNSKTAIVITAPLIECFKEMTARLLLSRDVCTFDNVNHIINSNKRESSILFQFQRKMHRTVTALLTIYVIFFGFKLILSGDIPPKKDIINFVLKMLFVTYFAVGININPGGGDNDYGRLDGMIQWAFPLLLGGIDTLAGWVMNAAPSELCKFDDTDLAYDAKLAYMPLWDALDCRISHYLGLDMLSTLLVENASKGFDFFSFSAPPYVYLLIPAIISGNLTLIPLALAYPLLVISVGAFMINATIMCMISIVILSVLAPLFVPMLLFDYTRGYFEAWVKLLISFLLQPMVVTTFMILMFSVYDFGFYGHCRYNNTIIENSVEDILITGNIAPKRQVKIFYIDTAFDTYPSQEEAKSCQNSLGYMLNNPLKTAFDFTKKTVQEIVQNKPGTMSTQAYMDQFPYLQGIQMSPGMFFDMPKMIFEKIKDIILALITACFTLYLMYHFSAQLASFAADMTEGVALHNVTINPQAIFKAGMAAAAAAKGMMPGDKAAGGPSGPKDMVAGGADDSSSSSGPADSVSTASSPGDEVAAGGNSSIRTARSATSSGIGRGGIKSMPGSLPQDSISMPNEQQGVDHEQVEDGGSGAVRGGIQDLPISRPSTLQDNREANEPSGEAGAAREVATVEEVIKKIKKAQADKEAGANLQKISTDHAETSDNKVEALSDRTQQTADRGLQPGQQSDAEQEIKHHEMQDSNAKLNSPALKSNKEDLSPASRRDTISSGASNRETIVGDKEELQQPTSGRDKTNIKKDGPDENS